MTPEDRGKFFLRAYTILNAFAEEGMCLDGNSDSPEELLCDLAHAMGLEDWNQIPQYIHDHFRPTESPINVA